MIPLGQVLPVRNVQTADTNAVTRSLDVTAFYVKMKSASREN